MATPSASPDPHLSTTELVDRLRILSTADSLRLKKASRYLSLGARPSTDLLDEAFRRALDGTRKCRRDLDVIVFLIGTMRSIASSDRKANKRAPRLVVVPDDDSSANLLKGNDPQLSPEDHLINEQEASKLRRKILQLFDDDLAAQTIIEGMIEGIAGEELQNLVGLRGKNYASKRRLIRRRLDKAFPKGWKSWHR